MGSKTGRIPAILHRASEHDSGVVHSLTVANTKRLNVLTSDLMEELTEALHTHGSDRSARALLLRGAGGAAWIGGVDSEEITALDPTEAVEFIRKLHRVCDAVRDVPIPVIAVIRGFCLGPGLEIAAACDLRMAAEDASFGMPEARAGMPAVTAAALLPRIIGVGRARELLLTGRMIDSRTALSWGLIEGVAPIAALDAVVQTQVEDILMSEPRAIRIQKRLCKIWEERPLAESIEIGINAFGKAIEGAGSHGGRG